MVVVRQGGAADVAAILALLDEAGEWLVAQGRTGQWGTERQSTRPRRQQQARIWASWDDLYLAEIDGEPVGAVIVGLPAPFAPPPSEPDLYINLFVTSRRHQGRGVGTVLLDHVRQLAPVPGDRADPAGLLRR